MFSADTFQGNASKLLSITTNVKNQRENERFWFGLVSAAQSDG